MVSALVLGTVAVTSAPAQAADDVVKCHTNGNGYFCLYESAYTNDYYYYGWLYKGYYCGSYDLPTSYWDETSSATHHQYGGAWVRMISWKVAPDYEWLWDMGGDVTVNYVGDFANDKADQVRNYC